MKVNKFYLGVIAATAIVVLMIPFIFKVVVFDNQNFTYDAKSIWGSFLGGYLGGVVTLISVIVTIVNLNNENTKTNEFNRHENSDIRRLSLLPFLIYNFIKTEIPACYREVPVGVDCEEIDINNPRVAYTMNIKNCGLGIAYDISYRLYIENKNSYDTEKIIDIVPNSGETYDRDFVFVLPKFESTQDDFNICLVVFYKDILKNQYAQEIPGHVSINKIESDKAEFMINVNFFESRPSKHILDEISYSFSETKNREDKLKEYIEFYSSRYTDSPDENLYNDMITMAEPLLKSFYECILVQVKEMFLIPHLEMGKGDLVGFKKIGNEEWEAVCYEKRAFTIDKSITYFLTIKFSLKNRKTRLSRIEICQNNLTDNNRKIMKFNLKVKRLNWKINRLL